MQLVGILAKRILVAGLAIAIVVVVILAAVVLYKPSNGGSGVPSAPVNMTVEAVSWGLWINWTAPSDGGSPITHYNVYMSEVVSGSPTTWNLVNTCSSDYTNSHLWSGWSGLFGGHTYAFRVTASNAIGESGYSNQVTISPFFTPHAVQNSQYDWGSGYISMSWEAPPSDGGKAITGYVVHRAVYNEQTWSKSDWQNFSLGSSVFSYNDTTAVNGVLYSYDINAKNDVGEGSYQSFACKAGQPSAPIDFIGVAGDGRVDLTWSPPLKDCGSSIIGYDLSRYNYTDMHTDIFHLGAVTSYVDFNLTNGIHFQYRLRAINALAGVGVESTDWPDVITGAKPSPPTNFQGTYSNQQISFTWTPGPTNNPNPVGYYEIRGTGARTITHSFDGGVSSYSMEYLGPTSGDVITFYITEFCNGRQSDQSNAVVITIP